MTETEQFTSHPQEKIEILSVKLLDQQRSLVEELRQFAKSVGLEFGWHYLLDLSWIIHQLNQIQGKRIMDAGAGTGILQWYLAQHGAEVISVDRSSRADLPLRFRNRFNVTGLREIDLNPAGKTFLKTFNRPIQGSTLYRWLATGKAQARDLFAYLQSSDCPGKVQIYNQDLTNLSDIQDDSLDSVVAVSALEHNTPEGLREVVKEIMRVIKPGGLLLATLTAGRDQDWWHEASSAMCYTDTSLREIFELSPDAPSNYAQYDALFEALRNCSELRDNLASFYYQSSDKGMPDGVWDPEYQPVGICKIKSK